MLSLQTASTFCDELVFMDFSYPPPREKCSRPSCMNPYKYRDSKSKLPLCSLECYKAINEKMQHINQVWLSYIALMYVGSPVLWPLFCIDKVKSLFWELFWLLQWQQLKYLYRNYICLNFFPPLWYWIIVFVRHEIRLFKSRDLYW